MSYKKPNLVAVKDTQKQKNKKTKTHLQRRKKNPVIRSPLLSPIKLFPVFCFFFVSCGLSDQRKKKNFKKQGSSGVYCTEKFFLDISFGYIFFFCFFLFVNSSTFSFKKQRGTREKFNLKQHMPLNVFLLSL